MSGKPSSAYFFSLIEPRCLIKESKLKGVNVKKTTNSLFFFKICLKWPLMCT